MNDLSHLMKQAQKMQEKMQQAQSEASNVEVTGQSGAGLVSITMTGKHDVISVKLQDSLLNETKDIIEDLIAAAINDAVQKVDDKTKGMMSSITEGLPIPPGFKMPF
jgi:DNA-binding YbaB/EbfC family protein